MPTSRNLSDTDDGWSIVPGSLTTDLIRWAAETLCQLWIAKDSAFARDSSSKSTGSTSSPRATLALVDALRFAQRERDDRVNSQAIVEKLGARARVLRSKTGFERQRSSFINSRNAFTDAHLAVETAILAWIGADAPEPELRCAAFQLPRETQRVLEGRTGSLAADLSAGLAEHAGGTLANQRHDFITYAVQRALDLREGTPPPSNVVDAVYSSVLAQIGHYSAGTAARFDLAALVFGVALLHRTSIYYEPVVLHGLEIIADRQATDGSWPDLRTLSHAGQTLFVSSYEIGLTLANLLLQRLTADVTRADKKLFDVILRVLKLAQVEARPEGTSRGWTNDRNPSGDIVETWTTAVVCSLAARFEMAMAAAHRATCFKRYDPDGHVPDEAELWPDLASYRRVYVRRLWLKAFPRGGQARADRLEISDPTPQGELAIKIVDHVVLPIRQSWVESTRFGRVSILLPGEPGTRKTTLVRNLAREINWPLLTLTPPAFLGGGLEQFEASAARVFRDLQQLDTVVVLFDECEEFFRRRDTSSQVPASRTIGAFITAGMLPRLQAVHDRGRIVFVVATNALLIELDKAATRPGRFDIRQEMMHPQIDAQVRYLRHRLQHHHKVPVAGVGKMIEKFVAAAKQSDDAKTLEGIPFAVLDMIAAKLAKDERLEAAVLVELVGSP
jgi:hypothetical protein